MDIELDMGISRDRQIAYHVSIEATRAAYTVQRTPTLRRLEPCRIRGLLGGRNWE